MSETQTIYIPCERYDVAAEVGPSNTLTRLEQLVLEAIGHGIQDETDLEALFCLKKRPILDLLSDLLHQGYITIDPRDTPGESRIRLSSSIRESFARKELHLLATANVEEMSFPVIREMVSGHLMPPMESLVWKVEGHSSPEARRLVRGTIPAEMHDEFASALARSAQQRLQPQGPHRPQGEGELRGDTRKLLRARIPQARAGEMLRTRRLYLRLAVRVFRQPDSGDLTFQVERPAELPARIRKDIGQELSAMAKQGAGELFFRNLEARVPVRDETVGGIETTLAFLRRQVDALAEQALSNTEQRQARLVHAREEMLAYLAARESRSANVDLVVGSDEIVDRIRDIILAAQRQIVLVCPQGSGNGLAQFRDALTHVLHERNVQVFVLWGSRQGEEIDPRFFGALEGLKREARTGSLHYAPVSCRTNARLVLCDAKLALTSSFSFLRETTTRADRALEIAVEVRAVGTEPTRAVLDLLAWARDAYPHVIGRRAIMTAPDEFDDAPGGARHDDWSLGAPIPPAFAHLVLEPPAIPTIEGPGQDTRALAAASAWSDGWRHLVAGLEQWLNSAGPYATPVVDHENRALLLLALRTAEREVLVASPQLAAEAVDDRLVYLIRRRLETSELRLVLLFAEDPRKAARSLWRLSEQYPDRLRLIQCSIGARVLVWDDEVLVSSAGLLGRSEGSRLLRHGRTSDAGYHVRAPNFAGKVLAAVAREIPDHKRFLERLEAARSGLRGVPADLRAGAAAPAVPFPDGSATGAWLQALLGKLHEAANDSRRRAAAVRSLFVPLDKSTAVPWNRLSALQAYRVSDADLELAVCACLADPAAWDHPESKRWVQLLARRAWWTRRFPEAAAFMAASDGPRPGAGLPSRRAVELAALFHAHEPFCRRLVEIAVEEPADYTEAECTAVLALLALARYGWSEAGEYLDERIAEVPTPMRMTALAQIHYWKSFGRALPSTAIGGRQAAQEARARAQAERAELLQKYEQLFNTSYNFEVGKVTLKALFAQGQPLPALHDAALAEDVAGVRRWTSSHCPDAKAVGKLIDEASDRGTAETKHAGEHIEGGRRSGLVKRIQAVVRAARGWAEAEAASPFAGEEAVVDAALVIGASLETSLEALRSDLEVRANRDDPVQPLMAAWLEFMEPLLRVVPESPS